MALRKAYVDLADGQLHYVTAAGTGTPIVFFHQTASSWRMWEKVIARIADLGRPIYAFDTPGFGGSFDPEGEVPGMARYAGWMAEALDGLGVARVVLVGHHTGAAIACQLAADRPDLVAGVTMIGPISCTPEERTELAKFAGPPFVPEASGAYVRDNWNYLAEGGATADPLLIHRELHDMLRAYRGRSQAYYSVWEQDFDALFARLTPPIQIACAHDDVLWPYFERAKATRPDARAVVLPGGGNFEPDLAPDATADLVRQAVALHG